jgi:hypothetical protein
VQNEQQFWQSFPKEKCKLLQDATKQELECSLLGNKKKTGLNHPKCSHWKPTNEPIKPSFLLHRLSPTNFVLLTFDFGEVILQSNNEMQLSSQASALGLYGD